MTSNLPDRYRGKPGAMENVTQAVNDELMQSLDCKLATSNVNYVQSRRDVQYFPSSLSTFTPTTSSVARIPLTSGMDFIDPESVKIAFRVRNNDATSDLFPGTLEPSCFIKRIQLFALLCERSTRSLMPCAALCTRKSACGQSGWLYYVHTKSTVRAPAIEGETNSRSPGASASRELSINSVKQARTTLHTKKRQTHIPLHALQRLGQCSIEHEG